MKSYLYFLLLLLLFTFGETRRSREYSDRSEEDSRNPREWPPDPLKEFRPECQCVPGSDPECTNYDERFAAATLAEAVANFPDLTNPDLQEEEGVVVATRNDRISNPICTDDMCIACSEELTNKLLSEGFITAADAEQIKKQNNPTGKTVTVKCEKYTFSKQPQFEAKIESTDDSDQITQCIETSKRDRRTDPTDRDSDRRGGRHGDRDPPGPRDRRPPGGGRKGRRPPWDGRGSRPGGRNGRGQRRHRVKRQTVGYSWSIGCVDRGEPERYGSQSTVVLCNTCWSWRVLPEDYYPRYLNELLCDSDTKCLSNYGKCHQRTRNVNVLKNLGTESSPNWGSATVTMNTCCDCKISYGSTLHAFVSA